MGSNERAGLAVCRSLGRKGVFIDIVQMGTKTSAEKSMYVKNVFTIGNPRQSARKFMNELCRLLHDIDYDLLIPIDDAGCQICSVFRKQIEKNVIIALPPGETAIYAHNKEKLLELSGELGIPFPAYKTVHSEEDLIRCKDIPYPVYVKPVSSALIQEDTILNFTVKKVSGEEEMIRFCKEILPVSPIMIQETCEGTGAGLYLLAKDGEILSVTQQNRLHEPRDGGGSSYRCTVPVDPLLQEYTEKLIRRINWTGVAMVEFKGDPLTDNWAIMEINGRFWGSLPLTISSGLDYPFWLYQLYRNDLMAETLRLPTLHIRQRNLKKDLAWLVRELRNESGKLRVMSEWLTDFKYLLTGQEKLDVEDWRDIKPALYEWTSYKKQFLPRRKID
ncbi:carboxylate--amine ligase [Planococcus lenghuensis]|uniref:ATP-grasp domain-containing protein n=1 Tax=Planococcus lenghuensis TaxID=2213202 RepID=A0A1Q2L1D1_9BACL|nr:hypothetical protein [Planococcus lenghuensis]AQQ54223.1 hypothetical protein B0X71_14705 [Planococcus lenghuensis]